MINEEGHIVLDADGSKALNTIKKIDSEARSLKATLRSLDINSDSFKQANSRLQELNKTKMELNETLRGSNKLWDSIKTQMIGVGAVALGMVGFQFVTGQISGMIKKAAELSDSLATIRQKTGMTQEEVQKLNSAFGKFDTRTATKELRSIAIELGQLGIDKSKIADTTQAIDKLSVALEGEFANAAEVTKITGTLRNILTDIRTDKPDQDMIHLGNALLELGNAGLATAPVVSDIATRIGAVGGAMGLTSGQVLGISATLQELGLTAERGGTATAKILMKMTKNVDEFAQIAGEPVAKFTNMLNNDLYGAFKQVMIGSQKNAESATALAVMLKDAELSGAGASEVFLKLGKNAGLMDEKVALSTKALGESNKIMDAFALKNETMGAKLDKLGKVIYGLMANQFITGFFDVLLTGFMHLADSTTEAEQALKNYTKASDEFKNTSEKITPLLARYDELKQKGKLSKDEQGELNKIIGEVAKVMPDAISAFDELGGAMDINSGKAKELITHLGTVKEMMNEEAIKKKEEERNALMLKQLEIGRSIQHQKEVLLQTEAEADKLTGTKYYQDKLNTLTAERKNILQLNDTWYSLNDQVKKYNETILELKGQWTAPAAPAAAGKPKSGGNMLAGADPDAIAKAKKALEDYVNETGKLVNQLRTAQAEAIDDETQREVQLAKVKYENNLQDLQQYEATIIAKNKAGIPLTKEEIDREKVLQELKIQLLEDYQRKAKDIIDKFNKKVADDEFKLTLSNLKIVQSARRDNLKKQYETGIIDEETYNKKLGLLKVQELTEEKTAYQDYGKNVTEIDEKITDAQLANIDRIKSAQEKRLKDFEKFLKDTEKALKDWASSSTSIVESFNDMQASADERNYRLKKQQNDALINDARAKSNEQILLTEQQYKSGAISKEQYDAIKAASEQQLTDTISGLNSNLDAEQRKIAYQQAKRDKEMAEFKAAIQGAAAIIKAYLEGGPYLAVFTAAAVALEVAAIEARPLPEYAAGGKTKVVGQSGNSYSATNVGSIAKGGAYNNPSMAIIGEKGSEYVIPNWIYTAPQMANVMGMLEAIRVNGFAAGGATVTKGSDSGQLTGDNVNALLLMAVNKLNARLDTPIDARLNYDELSYDLTRIEGALNTGKIRGIA